MIRSKRGRRLPAWYSQIDRMMGKMYSKLSIKHFVIILPNLTRFLGGKSPDFILSHLIRHILSMGVRVRRSSAACRRRICSTSHQVQETFSRMQRVRSVKVIAKLELPASRRNEVIGAIPLLELHGNS